ncbi:MAG TPA: hypothetical protein VNW97_10845 [Candidatus Saccharimonadales bacterium]|nr:hypothetical protein [Candidatus Saccharimonadales bacterium]
MKRFIEYLLACMGTATVAALAAFYLEPRNRGYVAIGYAVVMLLALITAWRARLRIFLFQALVLLGVSAFRISMTNLQELRNALVTDPRSLWSTVAAILLLLVAVLVAFPLRVPKSAAGGSRKWLTFLIDRPEQPMFFVPVFLMGALLWIEMPDRRTVGWAIEGIVIFVFALIAKERSFRLTGLGLLMVCIVKTLWDVFRPGNTTPTATKYLTLMVLGVILLAVSFLYGRFRETLRDYL